MTSEEFLEFLTQHKADEISRNFIFTDEPWLFAQVNSFKPTCSFDDFRHAVANGVSVKTEDVYIIGSAMFGRSMNPKIDRFNRQFGDHSDLDVVIVSMRMFNTIWKQLAKAYYGGFPEILRFHGKHIFRGFVSEPDRDFKSTVLTDLIKRTQEMKRDVFLKTSITLPLSYRIYRSLDEAIAYQNYGLEKCQRRIRNDN